MPRIAAAFVLGVFFMPAVVAAAPSTPSPSPSPSASPAADAPAVGETIEGRVSNVDYARGVVTVHSRGQGKIDISTMPTTSVQSDEPGYHTLTDVSKGSRVQIFISRTAGKLVAQIIRLIKR